MSLESVVAEGGRVKAIRLSNADTVPCDVCVVGIENRANTELFTGQLAMSGGGITVDANMRTSAAGVFAAGDVVTFPLLAFGGVQCRGERQR